MVLKLREVSEGRTRLLVPAEGRLVKKDPVFYNPEMEFSRDLSIAAVSALGSSRFCDLLSGSGARGVRVANETRAHVVANDANPNAFDLIKRNRDINSLDMEVVNEDGNLLLSGRRFDFIDIDPFGSPACFVDSALRALDNGGVLAVTATDTAALCGTSPLACMRKYDAVPLRADCYKELALRILIGFLARSAARCNKGIMPLFSHCTRHYFRAYVRVFRGSGKANRSVKNTCFVQYCFDCLWRGYRKLGELSSRCGCGGRLHTAGPLWSAEFADNVFCDSLRRNAGEMDLRLKKDVLALVDIVSGEQGVYVPFYNLHKVSKREGVPAKPMADAVSELSKGGFAALRTHFSGFGIRTDAPIGELHNVIAINMQ
ncbi:MAG: tRNA (guanine(10)-N(2))-dimethyltransferase [Candidatus Altiarchaeota archaeon]|nr:tRNA (guanine(10)-N(2))-dimethyltransferase [Candidatus Altiarchaeota archaeon]